jgi:hypothetical protein
MSFTNEDHEELVQRLRSSADVIPSGLVDQVIKEVEKEINVKIPMKLRAVVTAFAMSHMNVAGSDMRMSREMKIFVLGVTAGFEEGKRL